MTLSILYINAKLKFRSCVSSYMRLRHGIALGPSPYSVTSRIRREDVVFALRLSEALNA